MSTPPDTDTPGLGAGRREGSAPRPGGKPGLSGGEDVSAEAHDHGHRDVSGGWLRPAVFGAMDGLLTNVSLIAGVGGSGASRHVLVITGIAGLVAGAFSMAAGEYVSVASQNELVEAEVIAERAEIARRPESERRELQQVYESQGMNPETACAASTQVMNHPEQALRIHVRQELGVDPDELPRPLVAAVTSMAFFALGALLPLIPYLIAGLLRWSPGATLAAALAVGAVAAFGGGVGVAVITERSRVRAGARQLGLAVVAAAVTYGVGHLLGSVAG